MCVTSGVVCAAGRGERHLDAGAAGVGDGVPQLPADGHGLVPAAQRPRRLAAAGRPAAAHRRHDRAARHGRG